MVWKIANQVNSLQHPTFEGPYSYHGVGHVCTWCCCREESGKMDGDAGEHGPAAPRASPYSLRTILLGGNGHAVTKYGGSVCSDRESGAEDDTVAAVR